MYFLYSYDTVPFHEPIGFAPKFKKKSTTVRYVRVPYTGLILSSMEHRSPSKSYSGRKLSTWRQCPAVQSGPNVNLQFGVVIVKSIVAKPRRSQSRLLLHTYSLVSEILHGRQGSKPKQQGRFGRRAGKVEEIDGQEER